MTYNTKPFENYQFVSIQMQSNAGRFYFPDLPNLREVYTTALVFYTDQISQKDINGFTATTQYPNAYITLNSNGEEFVQKMELVTFNSMYSNLLQNMVGLITFPNVKIQYQKSYVEMAYGATAPTFPSCFQFGVYYSKNPK